MISEINQHLYFQLLLNHAYINKNVLTKGNYFKKFNTIQLEMEISKNIFSINFAIIINTCNIHKSIYSF